MSGCDEALPIQDRVPAEQRAEGLPDQLDEAMMVNVNVDFTGPSLRKANCTRSLIVADRRIVADQNHCVFLDLGVLPP